MAEPETTPAQEPQPTSPAPDTTPSSPTPETAQVPPGGDKPDEAYQFDKPGGDTPSVQGSAPATDWREGLPESWREAFKGAKTAEEALDAYKRGVGYNPPKSVDDLALTLPEGVQVDEGVNHNFREQCVKLGVTKDQAQALMDWEFQTAKEMRDQIIADGTKTLKDAWGPRFEEKRSLAMNAVTALDRRMGGKFANALAARGLADDPVVIEAFSHVGAMISEDTLSGGVGGAGGDRPESPEDTYKAMNFKR